MRLTPIAILASALVLAACSANTAQDTAATPTPATDNTSAAAPVDAGPAATTSAGAPAGEMSAAEHAGMGAGTPVAGAHPEGHEATVANAPSDMAGMDHSTMPGMKADAAVGAAQAGWYRAGTFQPCGSTQTYKVSTTSDLDAKIRAGKMSATDPVYVRLEGSAAGGAFNLTRVAQVGSPSPVRDCPMTGTTTQG